jgi:DNA-binding NarL/FixJ family response regulator
VKKGLLLEPTEVRRDNAILVCGNLVNHRRLLDNSILRASGLTVIRCLENQEDIISLLHQADIAVIVIRQSFLEQLSESTVLQITDLGKGSHILAVLDCDSVDPAVASKMIRLGCRGVLPRQFSSKLFGRAASAILRGEIWAPRGVVSELLSELLQAATVKVQNGLTPQEARILELSSKGFKNSAIADTLFISLETVRWHKRRLNRKLRNANQSTHSQKASVQKLSSPQKASSPPREMAG